MDFYERVKQLAKAKNITIKELIISQDINYDTYNSARKNNNLPRADEAVKIARALGTTVEYLITGEEPAENTKYEELKEAMIQTIQNH